MEGGSGSVTPAGNLGAPDLEETLIVPSCLKERWVVPEKSEERLKSDKSNSDDSEAEKDDDCDDDDDEDDQEFEYGFDYDEQLEFDLILSDFPTACSLQSKPEDLDPSWVEPNYSDDSWFLENCLLCSICNTKHFHCLEALTCFNLHRESVLQCPLCFWLIPGDRNDNHQGLFNHYQTYHHPNALLTLKCPYCSESILFENVEKHVHSLHFPVNAPRRYYSPVVQFFQDITPEDQFPDPEAFCQEIRVKAELIDKSSPDYTLINNYVVNSNAHPNFGVQLVQVVHLSREAESGTKILDGNDNRKMLWHGTWRQNVINVMRDGLRIPGTQGQAFGPGIYFADRISKSVHYCGCNINPQKYNEENVGYIFLCEVQLGRAYPATTIIGCKIPEKWPPDFIGENGEVLPCDSVQYAGVNTADAAGDLVKDGVVWPIGGTVENTRSPSLRFRYSEYVVYDPKRVTIKYLVKVRITPPGQAVDNEKD